MRVRLCLQVARKLHSHKHPSCEEANDDKDESKGRQQEFVQLWLSIACQIEDDEPETANGKQERRSKALHNVLAINSVRQESDLKLKHF